MGWTLPAIDMRVQRVVPTAGQTVTSDGSPFLLLVPAGTLATLTVTFPSSPVDGQQFEAFTTQIITALTMNGGTVKNPLTAAPANAFARWKYSATDGFWLRGS
jgi:hypothetical protein